jgi:hypothetical protein
MKSRLDRSTPRLMKMYGKICKAGHEEKAIQIAQQKLEQ